ncbi:MAG: tetraacyldisaccharide 4'-kinase [Proteobacteria bacterium]|nr:tetraacyldisaccharide 4'-kinase [Pseudomonadota bacterium]
MGQAWLESIWYGAASGGAWLVPLAWLFAGLARLRRLAYRLGLFKALGVGCPVIVIGNLTVGGSGKTPLVIYLVSQLQRQGFRVGVISRGYGGSARVVQTVTARSDPREVGDEPVLIARRSQCKVFVGRDRVAAAQAAVAAGVDVVLSDDGLQHYALARDLEIVVVDGERGFGNGRQLPAGPLREPLQRLRGVAFVVMNGEGWPQHVALPRGRAALTMTLLPSDAVPVAERGAKRSLASFRGAPVHAVAGIGNPRRFFALLHSAGLDVIEHPFPDHYALKLQDLAFGDDAPVLMTEKDAVKCAGLADSRFWCLPVSAHFNALEANELLTVITERIQSKRH